MSRYIDADALKEYVNGCEFCNNCQHKKNRCAFDCDLPDYLTSEWERVIDEQPTVDAVPVVRCKECEHYDGKWCSLLDMVNSNMGDWFCAYGERRTDDK